MRKAQGESQSEQVQKRRMGNAGVIASALGQCAILVFAGWISFQAMTAPQKANKEAQALLPQARAMMAQWPDAVRGLAAQGSGQCGPGPDRLCVRVDAPTADAAGNARVEPVWLWPQRDWSSAWLPFAQWRVAHEVSMAGPASAYGQSMMALAKGAVFDDPTRGERDGILAAGRRPLWRIGQEQGPVAGEEQKYSDAPDAEAPQKSMSEMGPIALFADGSTLPARETRGQWFILASGPAQEAAKLAQALAGGTAP